MKISQFFIVLLTQLCCACIAFADSPSEHGHLVFVDTDKLAYVIEIPTEGSERTVAVELGSYSATFTLILPEFSGANFEGLRVEQRRHRCFSISGEGPHLDFYDFKRQSTAWKPMPERKHCFS